MCTRDFDVVDKDAVERVIVNAVYIISGVIDDTSVTTGNDAVLNAVARTDDIIHLRWIASDECHRLQEAAKPTSLLLYH